MISSIARQTWESWVTFNKLCQYRELPKAAVPDVWIVGQKRYFYECFSVSSCLCMDLCLGGKKKKLPQIFLYSLFFHKMLDTFSPLYFIILIQAPWNMLREQQAATQLIYPSKLLHLWHRLFHMLLFSRKIPSKPL